MRHIYITFLSVFGLLSSLGNTGSTPEVWEAPTPTSTSNLTCPDDIVVVAQEGECGAIVNFPDAFKESAPTTDQVILTFEGEKVFKPVYEEKGMVLQAFDRQHVDAPWPIPCDNRQGALIHATTGNTWTYNNGQPFTPDRVYVCTTNMKFTTGDCTTEFIPETTGDVDFPDTPEWQNITSMTWEEIGGRGDASIDNFRFTPSTIKQTQGLTSGCFFPVGTTTVAFESIDDAGNPSTCSFNVTVKDTQDPIFDLKDITIDLEGNESISITIDDLLIGEAADNCAIDSISLSKDTFSCGDAGSNQITVTVIDVNGNLVVKETTVTVVGASNGSNIEQVNDLMVCERFVFPSIMGDNLTGNEAYYSLPAGQGTRYEVGETIDFEDSASYPLTFYIYDAVSTSTECKDQESFEVTILPATSIIPLEPVYSCNTFILPAIEGTNLSGNQSYFTEINGGGNRMEPGEVINYDNNLTYPITLYSFDVNEAGCVSQQSVLVDLTACDIDVNIETSATSVCDNQMDPVVLTAVVGLETAGLEYSWTQQGENNILSDTSQLEVFPTTTATYVVKVTALNSRAAVTTAFDTITIEVNEAPVVLSQLEIDFCATSAQIDGDGFFVDLSTYNDEISFNAQNLEFRYYVTLNDAINAQNAIPANQSLPLGLSTYYSRVNSVSSSCYEVSQLDFTLYETPSLSAVPSEVSICPNDDLTSTPVIIRTFLDSSSYSFEWYQDIGNGFELIEITNSSLEVSTPGIYKVNATHLESGCTATATTQVIKSLQPSKATATADLSAVLNNHKITVTVVPPVNFESSYQVALEDGLWYDMVQRGGVFVYEFERVETGDGIQDVQIRDNAGCYRETLQVITLGIPQFFTPNGDGYNDHWFVQGLDALEQPAQLFVFDRFGKLLKELTLQQSGWDGTFNGQPLPSTDYWYRLELEDGQTATGHFSLKR